MEKEGHFLKVIKEDDYKYTWNLNNKIKDLKAIAAVFHRKIIKTDGIEFHSGVLYGIEHEMKFYFELDPTAVFLRLKIVKPNRFSKSDSHILVKNVKLSIGTEGEDGAKKSNVIAAPNGGLAKKEQFIPEFMEEEGGFSTGYLWYLWRIQDSQNSDYPDLDLFNKLVFEITIQLVQDKVDNKITSIPKMLNSVDHSYLFNSPLYSDFTIEATDPNFPDAPSVKFFAHQIILSTSSSVFERMFKVEMLESKERKLVIEDSTPATVEELLRFIYTGKAENMSEVGKFLLLAAHKYEIEMCKEVCIRHLIQEISESNFIDLFKIGQLLQINELVIEAQIFFKNGKGRIVKSPTDLTKLCETCPELIFNVFMSN